jgi:hypothetical protein
MKPLLVRNREEEKGTPSFNDVPTLNPALHYAGKSLTEVPCASYKVVSSSTLTEPPYWQEGFALFHCIVFSFECGRKTISDMQAYPRIKPTDRTKLFLIQHFNL